MRREGGVLSPLLASVVVLSGASALVYEVVWLRWLTDIFGASTLAVSTVLTVFMSGLALGSLALSLGLPRVARPLRVYGALELAVAGYALLLPALVAAVLPLLRLLGLGEDASPGLLAGVRFLLVGALLLGPTAAMGATFPLLVHAVVREARGAAAGAGRLYALNTAGAAAGAALAGFALLPGLGVAATNRVAAAGSAAAGLLALALAGGRAAPAPAPVVRAPAGDGGRLRLPRGAKVAVVAAGLSGGTALACEVAWTRVLALVLGSSVYAASVMLTTFLLGLALGSRLAARWADRLGPPAAALALALSATGLAAYAGLLLAAELPYLFVRLFRLTEAAHGRVVALQFLLSAAVLFPPALASGAVLPLAIRLAESHVPAGQTAGLLYAANTASGILGSFLAGFVLLPLAGIRGTLLLAVAASIVAAGFVLFAAAPRPRLAALSAAGLALAALSALASVPGWRPLLMTSGPAVFAPGLAPLSRAEFHLYRDRARLLYYAEGLTSTVSVERRGDVTAIRLDGKPDGSTERGDLATQALLAHLPLLLHPEPRQALVVGLGTGITVGSVLAHPVLGVTVVELERAVVEASRLFDPVNGRPFADPRTRLVVQDARSFLALTGRQFDVVVSEPSNPWLTVAASLFTRDFFERARQRMRPGAVFAQWLQLYALTPDLLRTLVGSFAAVFPHTAVFQTSAADLVLVGRGEAFETDHPTLAHRLTAPRVAADLERIGVGSAGELAERLVLDVDGVPRFVGATPLNTEDNARVEFAAPRVLYRRESGANLRQLRQASGEGPLLRAMLAGAPAAEASRVRARRAR